MLLPNLLKRDFRLVKDFISVEEERQLYKFFMKRFHRFNGNSTSSYETQHFDKVISKYRECTFTLPIEPMNISIATHTASPLEALLNNILIERIIPATKCEDSSDGLSLPQIMPCHVLDLAPGGSIDYHIDNKEYSGRWIIVLSLNATCQLDIRHGVNHDDKESVEIPARSLYWQKDDLRYNYAHAIRPISGPFNRLALLFRDYKS